MPMEYWWSYYILQFLLYRMAHQSSMQECHETALGMENEAIGNSQISASTSWNEKHSPWQARLNFNESADGRVHPCTILQSGGWAPQVDNTSQWLQVDLKCATKITAIATQGRNSECYRQWVKKYNLQYSSDGSSFQLYKQQGENSTKEFEGNADKDTVVVHKLNPPIQARYIRVQPISWNDKISIRIELYGCQDNCRILNFFAPTEGVALENHVIRSVDVMDKNFCRVQCYMEKMCVSYNVISSAPGSFRCELNNSTHLEYPGDVNKNATSYRYQAAENFCKHNTCHNNATCLSGFTCKGYRCVCPPGFVGENCQDVPNECRIYRNLTGKDRHHSEHGGSYCDNELHGWFRFTGNAGTKILEHCPNTTNLCGAKYPGYLSDGHPTVAEGRVHRNVCFYKSECKQYCKQIIVRNCIDFFVYYLRHQGLPSCNFRYCGSD